MKSNILAILFSILLFASCSTTYYVKPDTTTMASLVGMSKSDIMYRIGAPNSIFEHDEGYIMVYENNDRLFEFDRTVGLNPKVELYMGKDDICTSYYVSNTRPVKKFSWGKTIGLLMLL